jgi:hypothetical protein
MGAAAFLVVKVVSDQPQKCVGGVFVINAIGEPLEFAFNQVELIPSVLWNGVDTRRAASSRLTSSLFEAICITPRLLFVLSDFAIPAPLESLDPLKFDLPTIAVTTNADEATSPATVIWGPVAPNLDESRLYETISSRGLLFEPFLRNKAALREVYNEWADQI